MANGNQLYILQQIRKHGALTRRSLAEQMNLGASMVSRLTSDLLAMGLIRESGRLDVDRGGRIEGGRMEGGRLGSGRAGGRPSDLLSLEPSAGYAIGLDIGGNHQRAVLVNLLGDLVSCQELERDLPSKREDIIVAIDHLVQNLLASAGAPQARIFGLGVGLWGSVDPQNGVVYSWTETPGLYTTWKNFALRDALRAVFPYPFVAIDDIVRTMARGEMLYGSRESGTEDYVFALADTGIGAALMINGAPYVGPNQLSGEIGHVPVVGGTLPCSCGNIGCLETVASVSAILEQIQRRLSESSIVSVLRDSSQPLKIHDVIQAAEEGDKLAYQVIMEAGEKFGYGLAISANLLGPRRIIVGGSLSASPLYMDSARRAVRLQALGKLTGSLEILSSQLDHLAGARGAATLILNEVFQSGKPLLY